MDLTGGSLFAGGGCCHSTTTLHGLARRLRVPLFEFRAVQRSWTRAWGRQPFTPLQIPQPDPGAARTRRGQVILAPHRPKLIELSLESCTGPHWLTLWEAASKVCVIWSSLWRGLYLFCVLSIRTRGINFSGISAPGAASFKEWIYHSNMASVTRKTTHSFLQI